jgi:hypothetical protein
VPPCGILQGSTEASPACSNNYFTETVIAFQRANRLRLQSSDTGTVFSKELVATELSNKFRTSVEPEVLLACPQKHATETNPVPPESI